MKIREWFHTVTIREEKELTVIIEEEGIETYQDAVKHVKERYGEGDYDDQFSLSLSEVSYNGLRTIDECEKKGEYVVLYGEEE